MRSVRIVVRQIAGSAPALIAASVLGSAACDFEEADPSAPLPASGGTSSSTGAAFAGALIATAGTISVGGSSSGTPIGCEGYIVELPEAGLPADPGQICAVTLEPVMNAAAARVTLSTTPEQLRMTATGKLTLAPEILASVAGEPAIELFEASEPKLLEAEVSQLTPTDDGYTFTVTWPEGAVLAPQDSTRVFFRTALDLGCEAGIRLVHAVTEVHLCGGFDNVPSAWASAGDSCAICRVIAELAASPIIPEHQASDLPLGQAFRARVVELARVGQSVVLFAENDAGEASSYEWHASGGKVEQIAPDVVIWHLEADEPASSMQVAIVGEAGVAVVSYSFEGGMH